MNQYALVPFVRLGIFEFGSNIQKHIEHGIPYNYNYMVDIELQCYEIDSMGVCISCKDGIIDAITCDKYCFYKGHNLIGMTLRQCKKVLNAAPTEKEYLWVSDTERQMVYTFDSLGLLVWFSKRRIVTVICMSHIEDSPPGPA